MALKGSNALNREHAALCRELQEKKDDLASLLLEMHGRMISPRDVRLHEDAREALEDIRRKLQIVSLKLAAYH